MELLALNQLYVGSRYTLLLHIGVAVLWYGDVSRSGVWARAPVIDKLALNDNARHAQHSLPSITAHNTPDSRTISPSCPRRVIGWITRNSNLRIPPEAIHTAPPSGIRHGGGMMLPE